MNGMKDTFLCRNNDFNEFPHLNPCIIKYKSLGRDCRGKQESGGRGALCAKARRAGGQGRKRREQEEDSGPRRGPQHKSPASQWSQGQLAGPRAAWGPPILWQMTQVHLQPTQGQRRCFPAGKAPTPTLATHIGSLC